MFENSTYFIFAQKLYCDDSHKSFFRMMVHFMYCGDVKFSSNVEGIMVLAERYQISELKEMCEQFLCSRVNKCNALEMYDLADMYNCCGLKDAVVCTVRYFKLFLLFFGQKSTQIRSLNLYEIFQ